MCLSCLFRLGPAAPLTRSFAPLRTTLSPLSRGEGSRAPDEGTIRDGRRILPNVSLVASVKRMELVAPSNRSWNSRRSSSRPSPICRMPSCLRSLQEGGDVVERGGSSEIELGVQAKSRGGVIEKRCPAHADESAANGSEGFQFGDDRAVIL